MRQLSLMQRIVQMVKQHGRISTDELAERIHDRSRRQVSRAAQAASARGLIRLAAIGPRNGKAQGVGIWEPGECTSRPRMVPAKPINSVWALAA